MTLALIKLELLGFLVKTHITELRAGFPGSVGLITKLYFGAGTWVQVKKLRWAFTNLRN